MSGYKENIEKIHSAILNKIIETKTVPQKDIPIETELDFDSEKSILTINDKKVKIALRNQKPDGHYVLEYIFEQDLEDQAYYDDIL